MRYWNFIKKTTHYFINFYLALVIVRFIRILNIKWKNNIWVIGGNGGQYYSDNSAELHKYILDNHPEIEIYWIIDKSSPDILKAKNRGPILFKHSLKGNIYALLAEVLICNHSIRGDILRGDMRLFKKAFTVSLCHGVTAFKAKKSFPNTSKLDLIIATSDYEKKIKNEWMNNDEKRVIVTGFPRYDSLYKYTNLTVEQNNIFYMPTWRPWITKKWIEPSKEDYRLFRESSFFKEIDSFLTDETLIDTLNSNNYTLNVFFHKNLHLFIQEFFKNKYSTNINILSKDTDVQEQLINSSLLITDYSSVAWDFLFLDRPVLFYQFDYKTYSKHYNSYISMPKDLFGRVTYNHKDTIKNLKALIKNPDECKVDNLDIKKKFIKYEDGNNCKRVMDSILNKLENKSQLKNQI